MADPDAIVHAASRVALATLSHTGSGHLPGERSDAARRWSARYVRVLGEPISRTLVATVRTVIVRELRRVVTRYRGRSRVLVIAGDGQDKLT